MLWLVLGGLTVFVLLAGLSAFERASVTTIKSLLAWIARDLALPGLWFSGWMNARFVWRGNVMSADEETLVAEGPGGGAPG